MTRIVVVDAGEELADKVRGAAAALDRQVEVTWTARVASAARELASGDVAVLVAGAAMAAPTTLAQLHDLRAVSPATQLVLAFGKRPSAPLRAVVQSGACDILTQPFDPGDLSESLRSALCAHDQLSAIAARLAVPAAGEIGDAALGRVFTVASATGGCGKTFFATNLAYFLSTYTGKQVCIVDLDLQFGEVSTALRLKPRATVADLVATLHDGNPVGDLLDEHLVVHDTGVSVLAAPKDPVEADRIDSRHVTAIVGELRRRFDFVVVDTPGQLAETVLAAFDCSELLYILATLDLPSIRNMGVFLTTLDRLRIPSDTVRLILNKAESDIGLEALDVEGLFPQGFTATLPYAKEVHRSINMGMPVLAAAPDAPVSRTFLAGVRELLPADQQAALAAPPPRRANWLARLLGPGAPAATPAPTPAMKGART